MSRNASAIMPKPRIWMLLRPVLSISRIATAYPGSANTTKIASWSSVFCEQGAVRVDQLEYLRRGNGVAVVAEVEQEPAPCGADDPQQHPAAAGDHLEAIERALRVPRLRLADRARDRRRAPVAAAIAACASSLRTAGHREPGRLVDLPPQVEHRQPGDGAQERAGCARRSRPRCPRRAGLRPRAGRPPGRPPAWRTRGRPSVPGIACPSTRS